MAKVSFGLGGFNKPTPAKTTRNLGIAAFVLSSVGSYMASASYVPAILSSALQGILSLLATICLGLIPFFSVETTQKTVPIADVGSMDETKK